MSAMNSKPVYLPKSKRARLEEKKVLKNTKKQKATSNSQLDQVNLGSDSKESDAIERLQKQIVDLQNSLQQKIVPVQSQQLPNIRQVNNFNYSKLAKLAIPITVDDGENQLRRLERSVEVVLDEGAIDTKERDAYKPYTFYVEGFKQQFNVRKIGLKEKATIQLINNRKEKVIKIDEEMKQQKQAVVEQKDDDDLCQKKNRYFQISHEMCYKCGQEGHYAKNCISDQTRKCRTCFSRQHDERSCPQICFECGAVGHISSDCPENRFNKCEKCKKRGHDSDCCGVIVGEKACMNIVQQAFAESDLKKMKCIVEQHQNHKKYYHFNCFEYKNTAMPFHELRKQSNKKGSFRKNQIFNSSNRRYQEERQFFSVKNYERQKVYDHYRDRYQRQYGTQMYGGNKKGQDRWQNRSFSNNKSDRGQNYQRYDSNQRRYADNSGKKGNSKKNNQYYY